MSPLGKSGKFFANPHQMRAHGDAPDEKDGKKSAHEGAASEGEHEGKGDGRHHHMMTQHEDGSYSSEHTHPDGRVEHMDHPDFKHAVKHQAEMFGEEHDGQDEHEPDGDEGEAGGEAGESSSSGLDSLYKA